MKTKKRKRRREESGRDSARKRYSEEERGEKERQADKKTTHRLSQTGRLICDYHLCCIARYNKAHILLEHPT